ncbi:MAG TPA: efflux RND transporter periplasmic adaptor subunit [Polyangiaceae bacterium]|nr:efflux RND transporter periplasmic adaptor subunit [Polyangiaceae bacterium]
MSGRARGPGRRRGAGALFAIVAALASACKGGEDAGGVRGEGGGRGGGRGGKGGRGIAYPVDVLAVEAKQVDYVINAPGTLEAFERIQVTSRVAGAVDKVSFAEGQEVKTGQVLVVIDAERYRLAVNSARAALEKAKAAQADTESMLRRREGASDQNPGLIPGEEIETYRTRGLTAKADTAVASEALRSAELNLRDSQVRAPAEGVIQTRTVETGQYVQPGYVMATLLRRDPMLLRFNVTSQEAPRIKPGAVATFKLRETTRVYEAKVTLVAAAADPESRLVPVTAEVTTEGHAYWLRPGSFADVTLNVGAGRQSPVVPRSAVRPSERGFVAFVVQDGRAQERQLQLGMNTADGWVEVRDGLAPGDQLVVRGAEPLSQGAQVRPNAVSADQFTRPDAPGEPAPPLPAPYGSGPRGRRGGAGPAGSGAPPGSAAPGTPTAAPGAPPGAAP